MSPRLSLRGRLVAAVTVVSLASLGAAFTIVSLAFSLGQQRQLDNALLVLADEEILDLTSGRGASMAVRDRPGPAANDVGPLPHYAALYDSTGAPLSATSTFGGSPPPISDLSEPDRNCFDLQLASERLRAVVVTVPVKGDPRRPARLLVAAPRTDLDGDASLLRRAMLVVFCVAVAWTVALALWVIGRLTRPHRAIIATAQKIAAGDLSARVGMSGNDDVARLGHTIDEMLDRLSLLLRSQQQFIAHAAHELRSPVTLLYGELTNALRRSRSTAEYRAAIDEALGSTRRMKDLIEDLLGLARLGADSARADATTPLADTIQDALNAVGSERVAKAVWIASQPLAVSVVGRAPDLTRMFRNLFENGIRHNPTGTRIFIEAALRGSEVQIHIGDDGAGISEEERRRIFEPFFRGANVRAGSSGGAGLGLTIARDIARLYSGDIVLNERSRAGAHFIVTLLLAPGAQPAER